MRVLHVVGCYPPATEWGGAAVAARALVEAAASAGVETEVFTTTQRMSRALPPIPPGRAQEGRVAVHRHRAVHRLQRAFLAPAMWPALRRAVPSFDLVHAHMVWDFPPIAAAVAARRAAIPWVVSPHGSLDPWSLGQRPLEKRLFRALGVDRNLAGAAFLHFTAEGERQVAPPWASGWPAEVIPLPVDAAPFADLRRPPAGGPPEVLILGRVTPQKGFDLLLPAFRLLLDRLPSARLTVAGPDERGHLAEVRAAAERLGLAGAVAFTGHVDAAGRAALFERAALLVAPSRHENFGLAVAEAMAAGLPVVVSDQVRTGPDIAAAGAGLVIPGDPVRLGDALLALLADPARRERMGVAGRRLVRERYSRAAVGAALAAAYARAVEGAGRHRP